MNRLRVGITTLGCKVNHADADALMMEIGDFGQEVPFAAMADLYIINSCTVTATADRQSRQLIHRARRRSPGAAVVLTGCMASSELPATLPVDRVFPFLQHRELVLYARSLPRTEQGSATPSGPCEDRGAPSRARPFLKIQDGCDASCSYCVVSRVRGQSRSVPADQVRSQILRLAGQGYGEVVLTGIHLGQYGADLQPPITLGAVVQGNLGLVPRLRLSSVEPLEVDPLLEQLLCEDARLCPHLHVPVQSGDDHMLEAMNRPYEAAQVQALLERMRRRGPHLALGADLMAGFPGEDQAAFDRTLRLVREAPLTHVHVFPYSPRPGTVAAALPRQVPGPTARERAASLRRAGARKLEIFAETQVGLTRQVLVEQRRDDGRLWGLTDNYLRVAFQGPDPLLGQLVLVQLQGTDQGQLYGAWMEASPRTGSLS